MIAPGTRYHLVLRLLGTPSLGSLHRICWHTLKRTTVKLPDELDAKLRHEAERRGITVSELTRNAIEDHLGGRRRRLRAAGAGHSGRDDISERIEEILAAEVAP